MATVIIEESTKFSAIIDESRQPSVIVGPVTSTGSFLQLTDTPSTLGGYAGNIVVVNPTETGLMFTPNTGGGASTEFQYRTELEAVFKTASNTMFKELGYGTDGLETVSVYTASDKLTRLFSQTLTYTNSVLTEVYLYDETSKYALTKTLNYSGTVLVSIGSLYALAIPIVPSNSLTPSDTLVPQG